MRQDLEITQSNEELRRQVEVAKTFLELEGCEAFEKFMRAEAAFRIAGWSG